jgi:hypothetical protein
MSFTTGYRSRNLIMFTAPYAEVSFILESRTSSRQFRFVAEAGWVRYCPTRLLARTICPLKQKNPQSKSSEDCTLIYFILFFPPRETVSSLPESTDQSPGRSSGSRITLFAMPSRIEIQWLALAFVPGYSGGTAPDSGILPPTGFPIMPYGAWSTF